MKLETEIEMGALCGAPLCLHASVRAACAAARDPHPGAAAAARQSLPAAPLSTCRRKKEHTERLKREVAALEAENAALQSLLLEMHTTGAGGFPATSELQGLCRCCAAGRRCVRVSEGGRCGACAASACGRHALAHPTSAHPLAPPAPSCRRPVPAARGQQRRRQPVAAGGRHQRRPHRPLKPLGGAAACRAPRRSAAAAPASPPTAHCRQVLPSVCSERRCLCRPYITPAPRPAACLHACIPFSHPRINAGPQARGVPAFPRLRHAPPLHTRQHCICSVNLSRCSLRHCTAHLSCAPVFARAPLPAMPTGPHRYT